MNKNKYIIFFVSFIQFLLLSSCFKDIDTEYMDPIITISSPNDLRSTQTYYKFEEDSVRLKMMEETGDLSNLGLVSFNHVRDWDLAFETGEEGWHILINNSNSAMIANTGINDFDAFDYETATLLKDEYDIKGLWKFDHPNGDPDSTAVGYWQDSSKVYYLNRGNGYDYTECWYKIEFLSVTATEYSFRYYNFNTNEYTTASIQKEAASNYVYYSICSHEKEIIDPGRNSWDILFTPYMGYYMDLEGAREPYGLSGAYINYLNGVRVIEINDEDVIFDSINLSIIDRYDWENTQDVIGSDWKLIPQPPDYEYPMDTKKKYIIHAQDDNYYKLRFNMLRKLGNARHPVFQYEQIY